MEILEGAVRGGPIRVAVAGANSPMAREVFRHLSHWDQIELVLAIDSKDHGKSMREFCGPRSVDIPIEEKLGTGLERVQPEVLLDFGHPTAAYQHALSALKRHTVPILACTLGASEMRDIGEAVKVNETAAFILPHFNFGAVLMLHFSKVAARWLVDGHILDVEADGRGEAPGGLTKATAEAIAHGFEHAAVASHVKKSDAIRTWRDVDVQNVRMRFGEPYQEVLFSSPGETLSIRYQQHDPVAAIDGIRFALLKTRTASGLTVGLEKLMFG